MSLREGSVKTYSYKLSYIRGHPYTGFRLPYLRRSKVLRFMALAAGWRVTLDQRREDWVSSIRYEVGIRFGAAPGYNKSCVKRVTRGSFSRVLGQAVRVTPSYSEAPHLRNSVPRPTTDLKKTSKQSSIKNIWLRAVGSKPAIVVKYAMGTKNVDPNMWGSPSA